MACLTHHGRPIAGIIHFPFRNETWAALNGTWVSRPYEMVMPSSPSTIGSRPHAGSIAKLYPTLNMVAAGGSGYKSVEVLKGHHTTYMHATKIKAWDICAPDALIHAAGGTFVNLMGRRYNYTTHVFKDGLYASIVYSWSMFRMYMFIMSKWFKLILITIVYASLYLFIRRKAQTSTLPQTIDGKHVKLAFWKCVVGLVGSYLVWVLLRNASWVIHTAWRDSPTRRWPYGYHVLEPFSWHVDISRRLGFLLSYFHLLPYQTSFRPRFSTRHCCTLFSRWWWFLSHSRRYRSC